MARAWTSNRVEWALPLFGIVSTISAVGGCFYLMLFVFSQPTVYPNPGTAMAPPAASTRLEPLPRQSDAPELAVSVDPASPLTALALAPTAEKQITPEIRPPAQKHARAALPFDPGKTGYPPVISDNRDGSGRQRYSGGPKS